MGLGRQSLGLSKEVVGLSASSGLPLVKSSRQPGQHHRQTGLCRCRSRALDEVWQPVDRIQTIA
eukprot:768667-Hanusia_phi.AAC.11